MNKILVVADTIEHDPIAIKQAVKLADTYSASLDIVYFCFEDLRGIPASTNVDVMKSKIIATIELNAKNQLESIDMENVDYDSKVVWEKNIPLWVENYVSENDPVLVVKTGHRSEKFFYTPTDWQLLRECQAPFMIVSEEKWRKSPNVLAAVDLGTKLEDKQLLNHKVLSQSKQLAKYNNSKVFVVYTVPFSPFLRDLGMQFTDELQADAIKEHKAKIAELAKQYDIPVENFIIHVGSPEKAIPSTAAKCKAGVVVIGTVGRKGIAGRLMGNTAEQILKLLKSDVLALKP